MTGPIKHPTVDAVIAIHHQVLSAHGSSDGLRSRELLESAVSAPQATMMGEPLISGLIEIAAAYFYYLCSNHPFIDGNKRIALATCLVFLSENGLLPNENLDPDDWENLTLDIASGTLNRSEATLQLRALIDR